MSSLFRNSVLFSFVFFCLSCQKKTRTDQTNLSQKDTIAIIETALSDQKLDSLIYRFFPGKTPKLISNEYVKPHYKIVFKGKYVPIVSYDSTLHNPTFYPIPVRFFGEVFHFKKVSDQQVSIYLLFRGTGLTADFTIKKFNNKWQVTKRIYGKF